MPLRNDFDWDRGEDVLITFTEGPTDTTTTNISGWTIQCIVKRSLDDATPVVTIAAVPISPTVGVYGIIFDAAVNTTTLAAGHYHYVVSRTDTGSVADLSVGKIVVNKTARLA